jgi:Phage integrase, N-terminal SAM-like domain
VERTWLPSKHIELTTRAAYHSNLDKHFFPFFGDRPMARILPSNVQEWVTMATAQGLTPRSVRKYHVMLHSIFQVDGQDCRAPAEIFGGLPLAAQATGRSDSTY